jgi:hypothetical protein
MKDKHVVYVVQLFFFKVMDRIHSVLYIREESVVFLLFLRDVIHFVGFRE